MKGATLSIWLVVGWFVAIATGYAWLANYKATPGLAAETSETWPAESRIQRDRFKPTLVMFAHPRCPCTAASLKELSEIQAVSGDSARVIVAFFEPGDADDEWHSTPLWRDAPRIPGAYVIADIDGSEAAHFGATTSGHVFVFDSSGKLLYCGGITGARGHLGPNAGRDSTEAAIHGSNRESSPVYGCSLFSRSTNVRK